ncbi:MAG: single-stranded-DNA-specific exonuclease RecJ [Chloroflexi bacterium RBG_16_50_9]|nr:MAG: single-stranded-DNA-specific exonuclease RecJ [Chloroflexi bacterium RBG_16_50_9]
MSLSHSRWNLLPLVPPQQPGINSGLSPLLVQLLYNRGIIRPEMITSFLAGDRSLADDPFLLPDMPRAVSRIYQALLSGENIGIFGDFDADGITATATLVQGLSALGGKATPYIPHRQTEGHGLTITALKNLFQKGVSLVITVDCGITDLLQVKQAKKMGLDIIITDHHTPLPETPDAIAVVDPKLVGSGYAFTQFSGVGVAYKLIQALLQSLGKEEHLTRLVDMVAIGTIADMSPLVGENRDLVKEGLKVMNAGPRPGIRELMNQTRLNTEILDAEKISWVIAPCLNAAGRLADGLTGYNLLMTDSPEQARELAIWLAQKNEERQRLTTTTLALAREQVIAQGLPPLLIASDKDYLIGIAGLVASRLTEEFYRPSIVIQKGEKISHASCRSIPEFNIIDALNRFSHLFSRYGGHAQAAGFTLPTRNLARLQEELSLLAAEQLTDIELRPRLDIDAQVTLPELGGDTFQTTQMLAPCGVGNPVPTFISRRVEVVERRTMGNGGEHLKMKLRQGGTVWDAVGFRLGSHLSGLSAPVDIVYNLEVDRWCGKEQLRLNILDFTASNRS